MSWLFVLAGFKSALKLWAWLAAIGITLYGLGGNDDRRKPS